MKRLLLSAILTAVAASTTQAQPISPMCNTTFDQSAPFNSLCPGGSVAGCGPIALAQILCHYKAPEAAQGTGAYTYKGTADTVSLDGLRFDWDKILDKYPKNEYPDNTKPEAKAVAELVYACGAAMRVIYGGSTSVPNYSNMLYGMQHNMHISVDSRVLKRVYYSTAEWIEMLDKQLRDGHPVFYRGTWYGPGNKADHMFLIDGINNAGQYHVNFGHGGSGDKFADINYLNQSGTNPGNRGVCYNASQAMVVNCYPTPDFNAYPDYACTSEEPIILNRDTTLQSITVGKGETFSLSCRLGNAGWQYTQFTYGWALTQNGKFMEMLSKRTYGLRPGNIFKEVRHLDIKLPASLNDGDYKLQLFFKTDSEPEWREVWASAPTSVDLRVRNGIATVTPPDNHLGDPRLYLRQEIKEIENIFEKQVPGRTFELQLANETTNNFQNLIKLEVVADGNTYTYEITQPIYSQTQPVLHILFPNSVADLKDKKISSVKAYYFHEIEKRYIAMGETYAGIPNITQDNYGCADVRIFSTNGTLVKTVKAGFVGNSYREVLRSLPHGIYIIREGGTSRKISL